MAFVSEMVDEMRMYLQEDPEEVDPDTRVTLPRKIALLNRGIRAMFPHIYQSHSFNVQYDGDDLVLVEDTFEYLMDDSPGLNLIVSSVYIVDEDNIVSRLNVEDYEVVPTFPAITLRFSTDVIANFVDYGVRVTGIVPISPIVGPDYADLEAEVWAGPTETLGVPVAWAMSSVSIIPLDDRLRYDQGSVAMQNGSATPSDIMTAATYWMDRFQTERDHFHMPAPMSAN